MRPASAREDHGAEERAGLLARLGPFAYLGGLFLGDLGSEEVYATLWAQYRVHLVLVVLAVATCAWWTGKLGARLARAAGAWSAARRARALVAVAPLLAFGMRGTLQHRPINA